MANKELRKLVFEDWGQWLEYVTQPPPSDAGTGSLRRHERRGGYAWTDADQFNYSRTRTYEEALQLAAAGWHDGEAEARKVSGKLLRELGSVIEKDEELIDIEGQGLDVANFVQGIPEHWVRYERNWENAPGPIVKVVVNMGIEFHTAASTIITRGAAVAGMIECIELTGRSCELWVGDYSSGGWNGAPLLMLVKVKTAGQPLDMGRVMFALAHPSSLRRLGFRAIEVWEESRFLSSMGTYAMMGDIPEDSPHRGDIYIPGIHWGGDPTWTDQKKTRQWVIDRLREQGITINAEAFEVPDLVMEKHNDDIDILGGVLAVAQEEEVEEEVGEEKIHEIEVPDIDLNELETTGEASDFGVEEDIDEEIALSADEDGEETTLSENGDEAATLEDILEDIITDEGESDDALEVKVGSEDGDVEMEGGMPAPGEGDEPGSGDQLTDEEGDDADGCGVHAYHNWGNPECGKPVPNNQEKEDHNAYTGTLHGRISDR